MACLTQQVPNPLPTLPAPLKLPLPDVPNPNLPKFCCKTPPLPIEIDEIPPFPPLVINPAFIAAINKYVGIMNKYLDKTITLECPKE